MIEVLMLGLGGTLGALTRYYIGKMIIWKKAQGFPLSTLVINVAGSFLLAFIAFYPILEESGFSGIIKLSIMTGFLGAFTTFSTFSYESYELLDNRDYKNLFLYVVLTLTLGLMAAYFGMWLAL